MTSKTSIDFEVWRKKADGAYRIRWQKLWPYIRWMLTWVVLLLTWPLVSLYSVHAAPNFPSDPIAQCAEGVRLYDDGKSAEALPLLEAGVARHNQVIFAKPSELGEWALRLAQLRANTSDSESTLDAYAIALTAFQFNSDKIMEGVTLTDIGLVYQDQGWYALALGYYQQALTIQRMIKNRLMEGATLNNIGTIYSYNGHDPLESMLYLDASTTVIPTTHLTDTGYVTETNQITATGHLTVRDIYSWKLSTTNLVVLSACETQMNELSERNIVSAGDDIVGLTRAFFFAGAPSVLATLWSVDDEPTEQLMEHFYTNLQKGIGKAEALRQAQFAIREDYPNPYYWAGFVLSGDGGPLNATLSKMIK